MLNNLVECCIISHIGTVNVAFLSEITSFTRSVTGFWVEIEKNWPNEPGNVGLFG